MYNFFGFKTSAQKYLRLNVQIFLLNNYDESLQIYILKSM